jgi:hypothetical protein
MSAAVPLLTHMPSRRAQGRTTLPSPPVGILTN